MQAEGRLQEAEECIRGALARLQAALPEDHAYIAISCNNLGVLVEKVGQR